METRDISGIRNRLWLLGTLALGLAAACSSSSGNGNGSSGSGGSGADASTTIMDSGSSGITATCGLLQTVTGGMAGSCPSGQTCCTTATGLTSASAACVPAGQCNGVSNECNTTADCSSGVCCAGVAADAGRADGGGLAAGIGSLVMMFDTTCQASCFDGQTQRCVSDGECPTGQTCVDLAAGFDAGVTGDAAAPTFKLCLAPRPDGGQNIPDASATSEAGPTPEVDSGVDASTDQ